MARRQESFSCHRSCQMNEQAMTGLDVAISRQPRAADLLNRAVKVSGRALCSGVLHQAPRLS